ncbi:MAG TPA: NAD(P)H-hydrate dehydratase [Bdellovibrionota bacterium]|jgi:NAD(P)H-hydrate epimerase|nr:NAD(P)H-hydrate dehydratase [Bdellovibrionota bacterium]
MIPLKTLSVTELLAFLAPRRSSSGHKYQFGRLQLIAGSAQYPGSAALCALGAFKAGCGMIMLETEAPFEVIKDLPELIPGFSQENDAYVMGPGLGAAQLPQIQSYLDRIPPDKPLLLDGGALAVFPPGGRSLQSVVLTPHDGEFRRLLSGALAPASWRGQRLEALRSFVGEFPDVTILLKGSPCLIYAQGNFWSMALGTVAMATAGQGDLLAGVIGAYLALGLSPEHAVVLGSSLCALAAAQLAEGGEPQGVLAHEVASQLPKTLAQLRERVR